MERRQSDASLDALLQQRDAKHRHSLRRCADNGFRTDDCLIDGHPAWSQFSRQ